MADKLLPEFERLGLMVPNKPGGYLIEELPQGEIPLGFLKALEGHVAPGWCHEVIGDRLLRQITVKPNSVCPHYDGIQVVARWEDSPLTISMS